MCWHACIEFPTDEEAHNDELQTAARSLADAVLALVKAGARGLWGKPDYDFSSKEELPDFERMAGASSA